MITINVYMKTYSKDLKVYDFSDIKTKFGKKVKWTSYLMAPSSGIH